VPKHEIINDAGTPLADELRDFLKRHFSEQELERLERLGGRVLISLTAPYISKSQREASRKLVIDQKFIENLNESKNDPAALHRMLENLSEVQLRGLCKSIGVPLGSKNTSMEIRAQLVRSLEAEDFWRRISGSPPPTGANEGHDKKARNPR
jgi:hypothetical protein